MVLAMSAIVLQEKLNLFTFLIKMLIRDITEFAMKLSVRFMVEISGGLREHNLCYFINEKLKNKTSLRQLI